MIVIGTEKDPAQRIRNANAARLRDARKLRQYTLRELADLMQQQPGITVTAAAISDWERGVSTPRDHLKVAVARSLDVPVESLFDLRGMQ